MACLRPPAGTLGAARVPSSSAGVSRGLYRELVQRSLIICVLRAQPCDWIIGSAATGPCLDELVSGMRVMAF